jgi:hypothetical protein
MTCDGPSENHINGELVLDAVSEMESGDEEIKGVLLTMRKGNHDFDIVLTDEKVVVLYIGESPDVVSSLFHDLTRSHGDPQAASQWRSSYQAKSPEEMIKGHQWNYSVPMEEVKTATLTRYPHGGGEILLDTENAGWLHFVFAFLPELEKARMLLPQVFGDKAVIRA